MYTTQSDCVSRTCIRFSIRDNLVHEVVDFGSGECISRAIAKATKSFSSDIANIWIGEDNKQLDGVNGSLC